MTSREFEAFKARLEGELMEAEMIYSGSMTDYWRGRCDGLRSLKRTLHSYHERLPGGEQESRGW